MIDVRVRSWLLPAPQPFFWRASSFDFSSASSRVLASWPFLPTSDTSASMRSRMALIRDAFVAVLLSSFAASSRCRQRRSASSSALMVDTSAKKAPMAPDSVGGGGPASSSSSALPASRSGAGSARVPLRDFPPLPSERTTAPSKSALMVRQPGPPGRRRSATRAAKRRSRPSKPTGQCPGPAAGSACAGRLARRREAVKRQLPCWTHPKPPAAALREHGRGDSGRNKR